MGTDSDLDLTEQTNSHRRKLDLSEFNVNLHGVVTKWLKKHGKGFKPKLSADQKEDLASVFKMMDEDGSGAIDVDELGAAFQILGFNLKRSEILGFMAEVDHDGTGELEYNEFLEVMTESLARLSERMINSNRAAQNQVPFSLMTTAYKRKKLLKSILTNTPESLAQVAQCEQDSAEARDRGSAEARAARPDAAALHHCALQRASQQSHLSPQMLRDMRPEELRVVASIASVTRQDHRAEHSGTEPAMKRGSMERSSHGSTSFHLPFLFKPKGGESPFKLHPRHSPRANPAEPASDFRLHHSLSPRRAPPGSHVAVSSKSDTAARRPPLSSDGSRRRSPLEERLSACSRSMNTSPQPGSARGHLPGRGHLSISNTGDPPSGLGGGSCSFSGAAAPEQRTPRPYSFAGNESQVSLALPMKGSRLPKVFKGLSMDRLPVLIKHIK